MKQKYTNKGKNDKNRYSNDSPIINNKKSRKIKISVIFLKCKKNSLITCN